MKLINELQGENDTKNILMTIKELIPTFNNKKLKEMN